MEQKKTLIDRNIDSHEICVRCLLRPMMKKSKKQKLDTPTVLPPKNSKLVSHLRLRYTNYDFCEKHGRSLQIPGNTFWGFAELTQSIINKVNEWAMSSESELEGVEGVNGIQAELVYSPMKDAQTYVEDDVEVFLEDESIYLPMHCDIKYSEDNSDEVKTRMRAYANKLIKSIKYRLLDDNQQWGDWLQKDEFDAANS